MAEYGNYHPAVVQKVDWRPTSADYATLSASALPEVLYRAVYFKYKHTGDSSRPYAPTKVVVGPVAKLHPPYDWTPRHPEDWEITNTNQVWTLVGTSADVNALRQAAATLGYPVKPDYLSKEEAAVPPSPVRTPAVTGSPGLTLESSLTGPQKIDEQRQRTHARVQEMAKRTSDDPAVKKRVVSLVEQQYVRAGLAGDASGSCPIRRWDTPGVVTGTGSTEAEARAKADAKRRERTCGLAGGAPQYQPAACNAMTWGTKVDLKTGTKTHRKGWMCNVKYVCKNEGPVCPNTGGTRQ